MNTQKKFEARLAAIADTHEVDLVIDSTYANVGTYSFQPEHSFVPLFTFPFGWQGREGSFDGRNAKNSDEVATLRELVGPSDANPARIWLGCTGDDLDDALGKIEQLLVERLNERRRVK